MAEVEPRTTLIKEGWSVGPGDMHEQCVTVAAGTLILSATKDDNPMGERARLDIYRPVGAYASPLSAITLAQGESAFLTHRIEAGDYCVRVNVSWTREKYVPGRMPPLWTYTRMTLELIHEPLP